MADLACGEAAEVTCRCIGVGRVAGNIIEVVDVAHTNVAANVFILSGRQRRKISSLLHCLVCQLETQALLGVHGRRLTGALLEKLVVKLVKIVNEVAEPLATTRSVFLELSPVHVHGESLRRNFPVLGLAADQNIPEFFETFCSRHMAGHSDDCNLLIAVTDLW